MGRRVLGVIVALITAGGIFFFFIMVALVFGVQPPTNVEYRSRADVEAYMRSMPLLGYITASIGGVLASVAAGWMVTKISKEWRSMVLPVITALLLTIGGIINYFYWGGQPLWFLAACVVLTLPLVLIGYRIAR